MTYSMIKEKIINCFRKSKCKIGHMIPMRTIENQLMRDGVDYMPVVMDLIQEDIVEYKDGSLSGLVLTQKGYDEIYTCRSDKALTDLLIPQFRKTNCKVGQGFMFRSLQNTVMNNLNPKEEIRFIDVCNQMIREGNILIEFENGYPQIVKLTEKGHHLVYG